MWLPTLASSITTIRDVAVSGSPPTQGGAFRLGEKTWLGGQHTDQLLLWVDVAGVLKGSYSYGPVSVSTDVEVNILGDTGGMGFRYVKNATGITIHRGVTVALVSGGVSSIKIALAADVPAGVALFDIEDGKAAWIACSGVVDAFVNNGVADGALLATFAGGDWDDGSATTSNFAAIAAETVIGAGPCKVRLIDQF